ncbi:hypothetical protein F6R98_20080 [Candidatus Methylospira mobilis]|uniref:Uncharacterized protein n=1 Tax=Candidatus Methylospira mobilis TaxID=1808979 RepID=A0A5Q0BNB0_9GAMM|nr:hypothetical protein [Candidatus Methylospira mobilis]QFY44642.1 hypothetical protein F6R98_20080 [Candidatus Methylospira mobilis]
MARLLIWDDITDDAGAVNATGIYAPDSSGIRNQGGAEAKEGLDLSVGQASNIDNSNFVPQASGIKT